jgi:hypothetical protein
MWKRRWIREDCKRKREGGLTKVFQLLVVRKEILPVLMSQFVSHKTRAVRFYRGFSYYVNTAPAGSGGGVAAMSGGMRVHMPSLGKRAV